MSSPKYRRTRSEPYFVQRIEQGTVKHLSVRCNANLHNQLVDVSHANKRSMSATARMMMSLGLEQYNLNAKAGRTTGKKHQRHLAKQKAEIRAKQAVAGQAGAGQVTTAQMGVVGQDDSLLHDTVTISRAEYQQLQEDNIYNAGRLELLEAKCKVAEEEARVQRGRVHDLLTQLEATQDDIADYERAGNRETSRHRFQPRREYRNKQTAPTTTGSTPEHLQILQDMQDKQDSYRRR